MKQTQLLRKLIIGFFPLLVFIITGGLFHWPWAGFDKPLYDWMQLLFVPVVVALIAVQFNRIDKENELAIASDNQRESALQGYFDRMSKLVLKENLATPQPDNKVITIARARTLTALRSLDASRKRSVIQFLSESRLFESIDLSEANLSEADLSYANLNKANLSGANLRNAKLNKANLSGAKLDYADLIEADLRNADLRDANLSGADLRNAKLNKADLSGANLRDAEIDKSSLDKAQVTSKQYATLKIIIPPPPPPSNDIGYAGY